MSSSKLKIVFLAAMLFALVFSISPFCYASQEVVKIGFNYPESGPYSPQGLDQFRGAQIAVEEINAHGGILGKKIQLIKRDSQSRPKVSAANVTDLIDVEGVQMVFGGVSSGVAVAVSDIAQKKGVIFMATITASNATTGEKGHRHTFRVSYNAWMGARALSTYLNLQRLGQKYFYVTADYTWGWSSEESIRKFTNTTDESVHKRVLIPFPGAKEKHFKWALNMAKRSKPDLLVLVLFGDDMASAIRMATEMGLKDNIKIVVPILELGLAEKSGPKAMAGVMGTCDWNWQIPYKYNYKKGKSFVEKFLDRFNRYPCWGASTAYTNLNEYKDAVERAKTFDAPSVIKALENHEFSLLKDRAKWRDFDHQLVQSVYVVKCRPESDILKSKLGLDYFDVLGRFSGDEMVQTRGEWNARRTKAGLPIHYEKLYNE